MQSQARRPERPKGGEARGVGGRPDGPDVNRDRLIFCITSLVGHKVTASLRNNVNYEGIFHSCSLENDYSITLKYARRLPSENNQKGGEVVPTLVIPGKDFLQVSALDVPPPAEPASGKRGFQTDAEISRKDDESNRELVPWQGDAGFDLPQHGGRGSGLEDLDHKGHWDQFAVNEKMYGVSSTFSEDLYTTKLDKSAIPRDKREQADKIAREIEAGVMHSEIENKVDGEDDDEEAKFSAVQAQKSQKDSKALAQRPLPQVPERPGQQDALAGLGDRGGNKKGMISEMKRINALNLEPTSAKHDDGKERRGSMSNKDTAHWNSRLAQNNSADLKTEFQQSLNLIRQQDNARKTRQQSDSTGDQRTPNSSFGWNKNAKPFSLNPQAGEFTPGGGATPVAKASGPSFSFHKKEPHMQRKTLQDILEPFFQRAKGQSPDNAAPDWPDAKGSSYKDVLGQPNPGARPPIMPGAPGQGGQGMHPGGASWQPQGQPMMPQGGQGQQNQVQQGPGAPQQQHGGGGQGGPQMNQEQGGPPMGGCQGSVGMAPQGMMTNQGFVLANAPGGPNGPPNQMYGQMYGGPGGGGGGPGGQQGQNMGPGAFVLNQPSGMGCGGNQMMNMVAQGQNPNMSGMTAMPKFGNNQQQMVVVPMMALAPGGQYQNQAFMQGGPMQGQGMAPQGGGPPNGPPQGDGGQGQMMQQPGMYPRQVGAG